MGVAGCFCYCKLFFYCRVYFNIAGFFGIAGYLAGDAAVFVCVAGFCVGVAE